MSFGGERVEIAHHRDFHGRHADFRYDETSVTEIHREVKLAFYLTDVRTGAFNYIKAAIVSNTCVY